MAITVKEVMNAETFTVKASDPVDDTVATLLALRLSAAPVVDDAGRPVGMASWRDLVKYEGTNRIDSRMSRPPATVRDTDSIEAAGRLMATTGFHHAAVVDASGVVVGFVSILDVVRGLLGIPTSHPAGFPHYDEVTDVTWSDDRTLAADQVEAAPDGAGVIALIHGGRELHETVVWAEPTNDIRTRLVDLLSEPLATPQLAGWLERGELRFRATPLGDPSERMRVAELLMTRARRGQWSERIGQ